MKTATVKHSAELVYVEGGSLSAFVLLDLQRNKYYVFGGLDRTNAKFSADPAEALWFEDTSDVVTAQAKQIGYTVVDFKNKIVEVTHACFVRPKIKPNQILYYIEDADKPGKYVHKRALNRSSEMLTGNFKEARMYFSSDQALKSAKEQYRYASATLRTS